jgi:anti-sigma B factor antagonist
MRQNTLSIGLVLNDESHVTLCLDGEIDMATAPVLREATLNALDQHGPNLHLDLSRVGFMDSTGLKVLISARRWANLAGGQLELIDPTHAVLRVLEVSGVDRLFHIQPDPAPVPLVGST